MSRDKYYLLRIRLKLVLNLSKMNQSEFARKFNITTGYVSQLLSGRRESMGDALAQVIAQEWGLDYNWLLKGNGEPPTKITQSHSPILVDVEILDFVTIGDGYEDRGHENYHKPIETKAFPKELVGKYRKGFKIRGTSMNPTLREDDYVGVDMSDQEFIDGELYLIYRSYEGASIKRLEDHTPDGILIKSDNPLIDNKLVQHDKIEHDLRIIGRVAWIFGTRKNIL